ncbi:MAG: type II toxin-antitoxin system VapB family antitoxin [Cytophagales bacterium]|nr:type II toxin-antitoxin system VapB family antitoxin [Cytophagales bacterium]
MKTLNSPSLLAAEPIFAPVDAMLRGVAKVFMTGRSQAVRLPKAFRFDTDEVTIEKVGNAVVLRPKQTHDEWWTQMESAMDGLRGQLDFVERDRTPLTDDIASFN